MGKPAKYCPPVVDKMMQGLRKGYTRKIVCQAVGVSPRTMRVWMNGSAEKPLKDGFLEKVLEAESHGQSFLVDQITFHGEKDWRANAWLLERTKPEFSARSKTSQATQDKLDELAVQKAEAEVDHVRAKTEALRKNAISPDQILELLEDARTTKSPSKSTAH